MAVYTTLSETQVNELLRRYALPHLVRLEGVGSGVENTTYFLTVSGGRQLVLTVFEMLPAPALPPYLDLLGLYAAKGLPVPPPLLDTHHQALQFIAGKPAVLFPRMPGNHCLDPDITKCAAVGNMLARLHLASGELTLPLPNPCGLHWAESTLQQIADHLSNEDCSLLSEQIQSGRTLQMHKLPRAVIHGDLFRDNVLFENNRISALIDFYNAGVDALSLDLAIVINDWCFDADGGLNGSRLDAIFQGYQARRPLEPLEAECWPQMLCWAATRFWLSRLKSLYLGKPKSSGGQSKSPLEYKNRLLFHREMIGK